jgi:cytochrome c
MAAACAIVALFFCAEGQASCDVAAGEKIFAKCAACHSLEPGQHLMGPSLHAVLGRHAGRADGFVYSLAMERAKITWTAETLEAFIADPAGYVPGTAMPFAGLKSPEQRAALVCMFQHTTTR